MLNQQQVLQMALNRCVDPQMRNIIQNAQNPQQAVQQLCQQYPGIAKQIDTAIGQGQNPQQMAMGMMNNHR